jgi:hypothetical protein
MQHTPSAARAGVLQNTRGSRPIAATTAARRRARPHALLPLNANGRAAPQSAARMTRP